MEAMSKKNILLGNFNNLPIWTKEKTSKYAVPEGLDAWLPYSCGCLIWHARKNPKINDQYHFFDPLFMPRPVEEYDDILLQTDILGLTNYTWNQYYSDLISKHYKKIKPDGIVVYGGPQVPKHKDVLEKYKEERPWVDVHIEGLAEYAFEEWLLDEPISGNKIRELPTPYSDGIFNYVFDNPEKYNVGRIMVPVETDRGCPYKCAFCDWGGNASSKITKFELQKCLDELEFLYKKKVNSMFITNANLGIFKDDVTVLEKMVEFQEKHNHKINVIYGGLAKNGSKNLTKIVDLLENQLSLFQNNMKVSFQTHTPEVLEIIDRANIKNEKLLPVIAEQKALGNEITAEMIITLPGETADSWLKSLHHNIHNLGIDKTMTFIALVVANTSLGNPEYQEKYGIKTKKVWFNEIQNYEIIYESLSYDLEEIVKMFDYQWFWHNFVNTNIAKNKIYDLTKQTKEFYANLDQYPILSSCVEMQRNTVRNIFAPESETTITDEYEVIWFARSMRLGELKVMADNYIQTDQELEKLFGEKINVDWAKFNMPFRWTY